MELPTLLLESLEKLETSDELSSYRLNNLKKTLFKKFLGTQSQQKALKLSALANFLANNDRVAKTRINEDRLLMYLREEIFVLFNSYELQTHRLSLTHILQEGHCGTGASVDSKDRNDFLNKMFNSTLSVTDEKLLRHYAENIHGRWSFAEAVRRKRHSTKVVRGSNLSFVPKDDTKCRTICTEPLLNMFYQLGAKNVMEDCLRRVHNLDVSTQPDVNVSLARIGSINQSFATIDLKDASDSISVQLCRAILPKTIYSTLDSIRCKETRFEGSPIELSMFSTMGNGFTFPLMTSIFSCLIRSVYRMNGIHPKCGVNYSVFGDDIIVIKHLYDEVIQSLLSLGFVPNVLKSFNEGFFRESCGGDFLHGHNVRGVYIKALNHETDFYSSFNRLLHWSIDNDIDISDSLAILLEHTSLRFVPPWEADTAGIKIPYEMAKVLLSRQNGYVSYEAYRPIKKQYFVGARNPNPDGALLCVIGGYIREHRVTVPLPKDERLIRYKICSMTTNVWDISSSDFLFENFTSDGTYGISDIRKVKSLFMREITSKKYLNKRSDYSWYYYQEAAKVISKSLDLLTLRRLESILK